MVEVAFVLAVVLLIGGVVGSLAPVVPGPLLSILGVVGYWWSTGYTEPETVWLAGLVAIGLLAIGVELLSSVVSARAGGASWTATLVAGVLGIVLLVFTGPFVMLLGVGLAVFLLEYRRHEDFTRGAKAAAYTVVGIFGSTAVQVLLTLLMLVGFVIAVV